MYVQGKTAFYTGVNSVECSLYLYLKNEYRYDKAVDFVDRLSFLCNKIEKNDFMNNNNFAEESKTKCKE